VSEYKKKLIEVALPLEAINRESAREKYIRHGHPSTLHLWWARRPLAACRAVLLSQLIDDPSSDKERFPTVESQEAERLRLFGIIERAIPWENSSDVAIRDEVRRAIDQAIAANIVVVDPFAGGGSIPLEAKRLGLSVIANDLNPLPVLLNTVLLEMVDRFDQGFFEGPEMATSIPDAIASDVETLAAELEEFAFTRMSQHYPKDEDGGLPLVYFWARTVACPNPACECQIPLVGSWVASSRKGSKANFVPRDSGDGRQVVVDIDTTGRKESAGTIERTGGRCPICGTSFPLTYVKGEGSAGRMGVQLLAVQRDLQGKRQFRSATDQDAHAAMAKSGACDWLDAELSTHPQYMAPPRYGLKTFRDLFLNRQLAMLETFVEELDALRPRLESIGELRVDSSDERPFMEGGSGARAYADALQILLALGVSRLVNRSSSLCIWDSGATKVNQVFARQAYSMTWLFAEANPFGGASGSFSGQLRFLVKAVRGIPRGEAMVRQGPAQKLDLPTQVVVSTDPPYYDSVPYADLADFFVVWLRRMLQGIAPSLFETVLSPKSEELVADSVRLGGKQAAAEYFDRELRTVFANLREVHSDDYPMTVYYAFKSNDDGWTTFLSSLIEAGWAITGTWPIRTEQAGGLRAIGRSALASSVVVVCRKRPSDAPNVMRRQYITALESELPEALAEMIQGNVAPVDLAQASIGPGMAIFTRYSNVLEADGSSMTIGEALSVINHAVDEVLSAQEGHFDSETRFCVKWFTQFGWKSGPSGEADVLARAVNTSMAKLSRGGVFADVAGKASLIGPDAMEGMWNPADDKAISVWEVAVRLGHALLTEGTEKASEWMRESASRVDLNAVKELSYLMFSVCERKGWADSALLFNGLGTSWSDVIGAARSTNGTPKQSALDFGDEDE
jgi:putative DNA methylase